MHLVEQPYLIDTEDYDAHSCTICTKSHSKGGVFPLLFLSTITMKNADKPAYPVAHQEPVAFDEHNQKIYATFVERGLTKREMFAMSAMQGIIAEGGGGPEDVAHRAIAMANELLKQLDE